MMFSKFNTFFSYEDVIIGYNAYNNDFVILDPVLFEKFISGDNVNLEELKEIHFELYNCLVDKGFIVESGIDEIQKVKDLVKSLDSGNVENYHIIVNPTMNCNFKCWYCYETHEKSKMNEVTIQNVKNLITHLFNSGIKYFSLSFFGGEPMLYFNEVSFPILEFSYNLAKEKDITFFSDFTTNGYLITEQILEKCKANGVSSFQITLDGHRKRHNEVRFVSKSIGSYDKILQNIKLSLQNKINVNVRLNISKETLSENIENIIDDFNSTDEEDRKYLTFSFHKVWQENVDLHRAIHDLISVFQEKGFNTLYNKNTDTVRESCYADKKNQATINYNGDIFKCTARDFKTENREGILLKNGSIEWNGKYDARMNAKFKNPPCLDCSILPICNGGCSQNALEKTGKPFCVHNFNKEKMLDVVRDKFLYAIS
ncbi:radical SAM/SPASM domain-containing protein [Bacteroidia bacterium]|nr:radical SAM/SPASM domain-containing protein [Bacteroidia bacterium]